MLHRNVAFMAAKNCAVCIHVGDIAVTLGTARRDRPLFKLELCTPTRWIRMILGPLSIHPRWAAR